MLPNSTCLQAAVTAPHLVCPRTTINFDPATLQEYSRDPKMSSLIILPATLALNISPIPWSNTISAGTLESIQLSTAAKGYCPSLVDLNFGRLFYLQRIVRFPLQAFDVLFVE